MRPVLLKLKGLNSFSEEQTIDFCRLTERGLFGIFGPTGSGKSSVLDAMTLALYDNNARNNREFINKDGDTAFVSFEFELGLNENKRTFVAERRYKCTDKLMCKAAAARFYEKLPNGEIHVFADKPTETTKEIVSLIGLSYNDFSRSVVLPQGKFSEFLTLKGSDRRDMLERIFHLERFGRGLSEKIRSRLSMERSALMAATNKLEVYGEIDNQSIENIGKEIDIKKLDVDKLSKLTEQSTKQWNEEKLILELVKECSIFMEKKSEMINKKDEYKLKEKQLIWAKKSQKVMPYFEALKDSKNKLILSRKHEILKKEAFERANIAARLAEEKYETAYKNKEINYPILLRKIEEYKQAALLDDEIKSLEKERQSLLEKYQSMSSALKIHKKHFTEKTEQKQYCESRLELILVQKKECTVENSYKQKVRECFDLEQRIAENELRLKKLELKSIAEQEIVQKAKDEIILLDNEIKQSEKEKEENSKIFLSLEKNNCATTADILKLSEMVMIKKNEYSTLVEKEMKRKQLSEESNLIKGKILQIEKNYKEIEAILENQIKQRESISGQILNAEHSNMAALLAEALKNDDACPVCGSFHHPNMAVHTVDTPLKNLKKEELEILACITESEKELKRTAIELEARKNVYSEIDRQKKELDFAINGMTSENVINLIKESEKAYETMKNQREAFELQKSNLEKTIVLIDQKYAILITKKNQQQKNLHDSVLRHKELMEEEKETKQEIENAVQRLQNGRQGLSEGLVLKKELDSLASKEEQKEQLEKEEQLLRKDLQELNQAVNSLSEAMVKIQNSLIVIKTQGSEKRAVIDEKNEKRSQLTDEQNPKACYESAEERCNKIVNDEVLAKKNLQTSNETSLKAFQEQSSALNEIQSYEGIVKEQEILLNQKKTEFGFEQDHEVKDYYLDEENLMLLEHELECFQREKENVENNLLRIENKLSGRSADASSVEAKKRLAQQASNDKEEALRELAVLEDTIKQMEQKLQEVEKLRKVADEKNHSAGLLEDLAKLMDGNRFVEYVAAIQLEYITKEASKRLKQITMGRYALELSEGEFIMRDDFNGGTRRKPATLSGGETFLTSFSLALALSSKIQMKNNVPLQFFFLDEGFGTLDSQLLDVVMTSLESLRKESLSVGIITHVEELKNRIPIKLMVQPAIQGLSGTKVKIE